MSRRTNYPRHPRLLDPEAYVEAADNRLLDAEVLRDAKRPAGAFYLAGLAVEIYLKAALLKKNPSLNNSRKQWTLRETKLRKLLLEQHDLGGLLDEQPDVEAALQRMRGTDFDRRGLQRALGKWAVAVRYDPGKVPVQAPDPLIETARNLKDLTHDAR